MTKYVLKLAGGLTLAAVAIASYICAGWLLSSDSTPLGLLGVVLGHLATWVGLMGAVLTWEAVRRIEIRLRKLSLVGP